MEITSAFQLRHPLRRHPRAKALLRLSQRLSAAVCLVLSSLLLAGAAGCASAQERVQRQQQGLWPGTAVAMASMWRVALILMMLRASVSCLRMRQQLLLASHRARVVRTVLMPQCMQRYRHTYMAVASTTVLARRAPPRARAGACMGMGIAHRALTHCHLANRQLT